MTWNTGNTIIIYNCVCVITIKFRHQGAGERGSRGTDVKNGS